MLSESTHSDSNRDLYRTQPHLPLPTKPEREESLEEVMARMSADNPFLRAINNPDAKIDLHEEAREGDRKLLALADTLKTEGRTEELAAIYDNVEAAKNREKLRDQMQSVADTTMEDLTAQVETALAGPQDGELSPFEYVQRHGHLELLLKQGMDLNEIFTVLKGFDGGARINLFEVSKELERQAEQFSSWLTGLPEDAQVSFYAIADDANRDAAIETWFTMLSNDTKDRLPGVRAKYVPFLVRMQDVKEQEQLLGTFAPYDSSNDTTQH